MWPTSGKGQQFFDDISWGYFDLSWEVVIMNGGISYIKQKYRACTLISLHHKRKFCFIKKIGHASEGDMAEIAFWAALENGKKQGGAVQTSVPQKLIGRLPIHWNTY